MQTNTYKNFLNEHPVFTLQEYISALDKNRQTAYNNLKQNYMASGRVKNIRKGLYAVVPPGSDPDKFKPDEILLASRLSDDAALSFHTALEVMGYAHNVTYRYYYYSKEQKKKVKINNREYIAIRFPKRGNQYIQESLGVTEKIFHGLKIRHTDRERTFIDCINRPEYAGGIDEVYRSVEKYPYLDFDVLLKYMEILGSKVSYARVGFFLEQHREKFFLEESVLKKIRDGIPKTVVYFDPKRKEGKLIKEWNLIVPEGVIEQKWEEFQT